MPKGRRGFPSVLGRNFGPGPGLVRSSVMAQGYDTIELVPRPRRSKLGVIGGLLFLLLAGGVYAVVRYMHLPLRAERDRLRSDLAAAGDREKKLKKSIADTEARAGELDSKQQQLSGKLAETEAE